MEVQSRQNAGLALAVLNHSANLSVPFPSSGPESVSILEHIAAAAI